MKRPKISQDEARIMKFFYEFLKSKGIVEKWKENMYNLRPILSVRKGRQMLYAINPFYHPHLLIHGPINIIDHSFLWSKTKEGETFWPRMDRAWHNYYEFF